jgi:hypothetical protein
MPQTMLHTLKNQLQRDMKEAAKNLAQAQFEFHRAKLQFNNILHRFMNFRKEHQSSTYQIANKTASSGRESLADKIIVLMASEAKRDFHFDEVAKMLDAKITTCRCTLSTLKSQGKIIKTGPGRYQAVPKPVAAETP